ncbi:MAG: hypothetical protein IJC11_04415 [Alphaproteobacteria bacterium]|nr:hypothetical protein [Alphaproteobacteria bacterium]
MPRKSSRNIKRAYQAAFVPLSYRLLPSVRKRLKSKDIDTTPNKPSHSVLAKIFQILFIGITVFDMLFLALTFYFIIDVWTNGLSAGVKWGCYTCGWDWHCLKEFYLYNGLFLGICLPAIVLSIYIYRKNPNWAWALILIPVVWRIWEYAYDQNILIPLISNIDKPLFYPTFFGLY